MTKTMKLFAASASAAAMAVAGFSASAQDEITSQERAADSASELNQIQLEQYRNGQSDMRQSETRMASNTTATTDYSSTRSTSTRTAGDNMSDKDMTWNDKTMKWNEAARATLEDCKMTNQACGVVTDNAAGVLVFPELTSASFIAGGTGGKGVLMVDGQPQGYYQLAAGSLGFQAGIEQISQVMTFNTERSLNDLMAGPEWRAGADAKVTAINTGAQAKAITDGDLDQIGEVTAITFNQQGLAGGVSVEGIRLSEVTEDGDMSDTAMYDAEDGTEVEPEWTYGDRDETARTAVEWAEDDRIGADEENTEDGWD